MKRLSTPKRLFTFTIGDSPTVFGEGDLVEYPHIVPIYNKWRESEKDYEREWRNYELTNTDWMLVSDATYNGALLLGSDLLAEIMEYRSKLRAYNLTTDDRPTRPTWFKD